MVHIALQTPIHDQATGALRWETLVSLRVEGGQSPAIEGERGLIDLGMPVVSLRTGEAINFADDPEEWTRSLVLAYRAGDLVATILHDDAPVSEDDIAQAVGRDHHAAVA